MPPEINIQSENRFLLILFADYNEEAKKTIEDAYVVDRYDEYNIAENFVVWNVEGDPYGDYVSMLATNIVDSEFVMSSLFFVDLMNSQRESEEFDNIMSLAKLYVEYYNRGCDVPLITDGESNAFYEFVMNK